MRTLSPCVWDKDTVFGSHLQCYLKPVLKPASSDYSVYGIPCLFFPFVSNCCTFLPGDGVARESSPFINSAEMDRGNIYEGKNMALFEVS